MFGVGRWVLVGVFGVWLWVLGVWCWVLGVGCWVLGDLVYLPQGLFVASQGAESQCGVSQVTISQGTESQSAVSKR